MVSPRKDRDRVASVEAIHEPTCSITLTRKGYSAKKGRILSAKTSGKKTLIIVFPCSTFTFESTVARCPYILMPSLARVTPTKIDGTTIRTIITAVVKEAAILAYFFLRIFS